MTHGDNTSGAAVAARGLRASGLTIAAALLMLATLLVGTAQADDVECGDVITEDTTLTHDVGPCSDADGPAGLIVRGDDVTLDLGGHRVFSTPDANGPHEQVGIRIGRSSGVTVKNGTVEGFDAGVEIVGGGNNTVEQITARNNINDMEEPWEFVSGNAPANQPDVLDGNVSVNEWNEDMLCFYGDGITTTNSDGNVIRHNKVVDNGPYGGITLVGDSDGNRIEKNQVHDNNINSWGTRSDGSEGRSLCGATLPGAPGMQRGRETQAIGIRLEGPGASDNVVAGNTVTDSALVGIAIHSYVCNPPVPGAPTESPNMQNTINQNRVSSTGDERRATGGGFTNVNEDDFADGIGSLAQGPIGRITCTSHDNTIVDNVSTANDRHGVSLHRTVEATEVSRNVANNNGGNGIFVSGPREDGGDDGAVNNELHRNKAHNNADADGYDGNAECDANNWMANRFKTVNQDCVAAGGGTGWVGGPGNSGDASAAQATGASNRGR